MGSLAVDLRYRPLRLGWCDNPVRFIDAFVDGLDLVEAGFARVRSEATGRPGYAPGDLLKLYIYGYRAVSGRTAGWRPNATAISR